MDNVVPPLPVKYLKLSSLFTDPEGDEIFVKVQVMPQASWMSYNPITKMLEGNPSDNNDVGIHWIQAFGYNEFPGGQEVGYSAAVFMMTVVSNSPPRTEGDIPTFFAAQDQAFTLDIDAALVDPEGFPVTITVVEIDGAVPTFMVLEPLPKPHLRGFTGFVNEGTYLATVKGTDNFMQEGTGNFKIVISGKGSAN